MKPAFLCLFVFFFQSVAFAQSGFVGNGGDGLELDGRLYLRDLVGVGAHLHPYFGENRDPSLKLPAPGEIGISYPRELLAKKLTDLNFVAPGAGDFLLAAIRSYTWVVEDLPLTPIVDPRDPVQLPPGAKLVQIASRMGTTIRLHRAAWERLNPQNQAALLLHEAVYSLVRLSRDNHGIFFQSSFSAREVTGVLFLESFFSRGSASAYAFLRIHLNFPEALPELSTVREPGHWEITYGYHAQNCGLGCRLGVLGSSPTGLGFQPEDFVQEACAKIGKLPKRNYWLQSIYHPRAYTLEMGRYRGGEPATLQAYLSVLERPRQADRLDQDFSSESGCRAALSSHRNEALLDIW